MKIRMYIKKLIVVLLTSVMISCATTTLEDSWKEEGAPGPYKYLMIIGVSDSQQTRRIYENYFISELKKHNLSATPSYQLISSKQKIEHDIIADAVKGTNIDAVLLTYLVSAESEIKHRHSPLNIGYSGNVEDHQISDTIVSKRGVSRSEEVYVLKSDLYDVKSQSLVWSARTKSVGPESVDQVIEEVTVLLIDKMFSDGLLK